MYISSTLWTKFQAWAALPHKRFAFSLDEAESIALKVLKNLTANPLPMPPTDEPPNLTVAEWNKLRYYGHFGQYHYAEAYMMYSPYYLRADRTVLHSFIKLAQWQHPVPIPRVTPTMPRMPRLWKNQSICISEQHLSSQMTTLKNRCPLPPCNFIIADNVGRTLVCFRRNVISRRTNNWTTLRVGQSR